MTRSRIWGFVLTALTAGMSAQPAAQAGGGVTAVTLPKAALSMEVSNDQRTLLAPGAGQRFLWVTTTVSGAPQTIDLTKVVLVSGADSFKLLGVDSAFDGDPKQFSMIAPVVAKGGKTLEPFEETRSVGTISFAFTPGKTAALKVITPPQSFCLLFIVPQSFRTGQINGLGAKPLTLPALAATTRP